MQSVTRYPNGNILRTSYKYDFTGNVTTKEEICGSTTKLTTYTYNKRGKLLTESTTLNGGTAATVTYTYDDLGRVTGRTYGNGTTESQVYNIQGWLTGISAKKGSTSIYNQTLRYYNPAKGTAALYSGNISEWSSQQASQQQETYGFTYDLQGRLTQSNRYSGTSTTAQNAYTERGITYDKNGNILTLQRYAAALQDNYTYTYNGNRLTSISGTNNGTAIASASYSYDNNGNTVQDGLKNLQITYNILNLPQTVTQSGTTKVTYGWFADGSKYSVQDAQGNGYCYIGSLIYSSTTGTTAQESTDFSGGRIVLSGNTQTIHYHHKDHLGSVRAITDGSGSTIEQNAYYPFGGRHTFGQTYAQTTTNRYKFNGKEHQTIGNLDLLDYGARMYDTKIGRWLVQDPLAEKYYPFSAYNYCVNNPVMFVDPDGKAPGPGDIFLTPDAAAIDWGKYYNGASIINKTEKISVIYKINIAGSIKYTYSAAKNHGEHGGDYTYKRNKSNVAIIHSHGNYDGIVSVNGELKQLIDNDFSKQDKNTSKKLGIPIYLSTPNGSLKMYDSITDDSKIISTEMPSDPNDPSRQNSIEPNDKSDNIMNILKDYLNILKTKIMSHE